MFRFGKDYKEFVPPKGPFLVISNHSTMVDFLLVMLPFYPRRLNAVTANKFFYTRILNKLLPLMGCIPKSQFDPDVPSIRMIKTVLARGDSLLMFPEGRCSTDGAFKGIHRSTGKLIKNLGVPVVSCYIDGAYTCMPYWRKGFRRGRIRLEMSEVISAEDTKSMTVEDINNAICTRLSGLDIAAPKEQVRTFRARRLAEGLHRILFWCPKCGLEYTMESKGNAISCISCGNAASVDVFGKLVPGPGSVAPDSIHGWYSEQTRHIAECLSDDMEPISIRVTVKITAAKCAKKVAQNGSGILKLDPSGWHFEGELSGEQTSLFVPIDAVPAVPYEYEENFQIYANGNIYKFSPEDAILSLRYSILGECAHKRFASRVQLTLGKDFSK